MNCQMIRVISSPSSSTTVPSTLILDMDLRVLLGKVLPLTTPGEHACERTQLFNRQRIRLALATRLRGAKQYKHTGALDLRRTDLRPVIAGSHGGAEPPFSTGPSPATMSGRS